MNHVLALRERYLVGLAASVAAGCLPCADYHVQKATRAGITTSELGRTVSLAAAIRHRATEEIVRRDLPRGTPPAADAVAAIEVDGDGSTLLAVTAAYAVNSQPLLSSCLDAAISRGASREQLLEAINIARAVRTMAIAIVDRGLEASLGGDCGGEQAVSCGDLCK